MNSIMNQMTLYCPVLILMVFVIDIDRLGPLVRSWCMRYEAKHHYFKRLAVNIGNFVNIAFSMAKRHQEGLCYRLQSAEGNLSSFIQKGIEVGPDMYCFIVNVILFEG